MIWRLLPFAEFWTRRPTRFDFSESSVDTARAKDRPVLQRAVRCKHAPTVTKKWRNSSRSRERNRRFRPSALLKNAGFAAMFLHRLKLELDWHCRNSIRESSGNQQQEAQSGHRPTLPIESQPTTGFDR
jgi:hypothetical protein